MSGQGLQKDLSNDHVLTTLHLCLSHSMKDISYQANNSFDKKEKGFILYCCSVLANCRFYEIFKEIIRHMFTLLAKTYEDSTMLLSLS